MFSSKPDKSCHLYISTNAYVVCAQKNRLNLRDRERGGGRERGREREKIITGQKRKCFIQDCVLPIASLIPQVDLHIFPINNVITCDRNLWVFFVFFCDRKHRFESVCYPAWKSLNPWTHCTLSHSIFFMFFTLILGDNF